MDKEVSKKVFEEKIKQNYPRLISMLMKNQSLIEIGLVYHENNRRLLVIEGRTPKRAEVFREVFSYEMKENHWYKLMLIYNASRSHVTLLSRSNV